MLELKETKVSDAMSISASERVRANEQSIFFDDVFRIELCDSAKSHLSVIDVSEIFRIIIEGLIIEENKSLMKRMMRRYIENSRTIILVVLAANVDIATTEILDMTAKINSSEQRTLKILTKLDLVDKEAEQDIIDLVRDRKNKLKLEYCVVRNREKQKRNATLIERHRVKSEFFKADS